MKSKKAIALLAALTICTSVSVPAFAEDGVLPAEITAGEAQEQAEVNEDIPVTEEPAETIEENTEAVEETAENTESSEAADNVEESAEADNDEDAQDPAAEPEDSASEDEDTADENIEENTDNTNTADADELLTDEAELESSGGACGTNARWSFNGSKLTISGDGAITSIPWESVKESITSVSIGSNITSIPANAFQGCTSLGTVTIPNCNIGDSAFQDCTNLSAVNIMGGTTKRSIGSRAFQGCIRLQKVTIPNTISSIGEYAFKGCRSLRNAEIPGSVAVIGTGAFYGCSALARAVIGDGVITIGDQAFRYCSSLSGLNIASSVTSIGNYAFQGCTSLRVASIPNCAINSYAFNDCSALEKVTISSGSTKRTISTGAFSDCIRLRSVSIPSSISSIGEYAFDNCTSLTAISVPGSVTTIGTGAFRGNSSLTKATLASGVKTIGNNAFSGCNAMTELTIPASASSIGSASFSGCSKLTKIHIASNKKASDYAGKYGLPSNTSYYIGGSNSSSSVGAVKLTVKGVFNGRNVTFNCPTSGAKIYYSSTTSNITTSDASVSNGSTKTFNRFYGTLYVRAYKDGQWGPVSKIVLKIPVCNNPTITQSGNKAVIKSSTPDCYIVYTTDGTTPSLSNGKRVYGTANVTLSTTTTVRAIAIRSCFTNSDVVAKTITPTAVTPATPTLSISTVSGGKKVTFRTSTSGARIYYNLGSSSINTNCASVASGDTVTFNSSYTGVVYARAYLNGQWSNVASISLSSASVATPTFSKSGNYLYMYDSTSGARIYYSMGSSSISTSSASVTSGSSIYVGNYTGTVYARAYLNGQWSNVASYYVGTSSSVATPTFSKSGNYLYMYDSTSGARIYYNFGSSSISTNSASVTSGSSIYVGNYTGTVYARAYLNGQWSNTNSYYVGSGSTVTTPTFSRSGNYLYMNSTSGSLIYYSMGSSSISSSNAYITSGGSIYIGDYTGTVYARAYRDGTWSSTSSYYCGNSYTVARPTITNNGSTIRFSSSTNGATIYYSTTTSNVTSSSPSVYNGGSISLSNFTGYIYARAYYNGSWSDVTSYYVNNYASYLTTPTLYGTAINNQVSLQWTSVSNAQNYYIYRYENGSYIQIGTVSGSATQCYVSNVSNGTHRFAIKAAASGQTSQYSNLATVTVNYSLYPGYTY